MCSVGFVGCTAKSITQAQAPASFQIFCADPQGYYPQVMTCPGGWQHENTSHQPGDATLRLLVIPVQPPISEGLPR